MTTRCKALLCNCNHAMQVDAKAIAAALHLDLVSAVPSGGQIGPQLSLNPDAGSPVIVNEAQPFDCIRCSKPAGTRSMIDNMLNA